MLGVGLVFFGSASKPYFYTATRVKHYELYKSIYKPLKAVDSYVRM